MSHTPSPRRSNGLAVSVNGFTDEKQRCATMCRSTPKWSDRVQPRVNEHPYRDENSPRDMNMPKEGSPNFSLASMKAQRKYHTSDIRCKDLGEPVQEPMTQGAYDGSGVTLQKSHRNLSHEKKHQRVDLASSPTWMAGMEPDVVHHHYEGAPEAPNFSQKQFASEKKYHQTIHKASPRRERSQQPVCKPTQSTSNKMFAAGKSRCQVPITNSSREVLL